MRTTITLPDDVYAAARSIAHQKRISLGAALAELVRRGLNPEPRIDPSGDLPRILPSPGTPLITLEHTLALEDDEW
jgi:hypothetical protein